LVLDHPLRHGDGMTLITVQDGTVVMRDGKVGTEQACCCGLCPPCNFPRSLSVTIEGFPDGYSWISFAGGAPPEGGGFSPNCGDDPANPVNYREAGSAVGTPGYTSTRLIDYNQTFIATYDDTSDECCPIWYGEIERGAANRNDGNSGFPALNCGTTPEGFFVTLCKENAFTNLEIRLDGNSIRGSGATGLVSKITAGAIEEADVTNGGSDYAYLEVIRVEPTVTASVSSSTGSGADLGVTLNQTTDSNGKDVWEVSEVTVNSAGSGYESFDFVQFSVPGGEEQSPAFANLRFNRQEPTLGIALPFANGNGATFSVSLTQTTDSNGEDVWEIDSVTVTNGGSGYSEFGEFAQVDLIDGVEQSFASFQVFNKRVQPTVTADVPFSTNGTGASLSATLSQTTDFSGRPAWEVASVSVLNGGTGYESFDFIQFTLSSGTELSGAFGSLTVSGGVIQSVAISDGGLYYIVTDEIEEVSVSVKGEFYKTDGSIAAVVVTDGGEYYEDQQTNNVIVEDVQVVVLSNTGEDAEIEAVIDDDPNSGTFGQIVDLVVIEGGKNYAQMEDTWVLNFGTSIQPLSRDGGVGLAGQTLCDGADQESKSQPKASRAVLLSLDECAETLLDKTYDAVFETTIFPNWLSNMPAEAEYSLIAQFGFCTILRVLDWGDGPLKVTISPA
jgi:hypothetical protein